MNTQEEPGTAPGVWLVVSILEMRKLRLSSTQMPKGQNQVCLQRPAPSPYTMKLQICRYTQHTLASVLGRALCWLGTGGPRWGAVTKMSDTVLSSQVLRGEICHLHSFLVIRQRARGRVGWAKLSVAKPGALIVIILGWPWRET